MEGLFYCVLYTECPLREVPLYNPANFKTLFLLQFFSIQADNFNNLLISAKSLMNTVVLVVKGCYVASNAVSILIEFSGIVRVINSYYG